MRQWNERRLRFCACCVLSQACRSSLLRGMQGRPQASFSRFLPHLSFSIFKTREYRERFSALGVNLPALPRWQRYAGRSPVDSIQMSRIRNVPTPDRRFHFSDGIALRPSCAELGGVGELE